MGTVPTLTGVVAAEELGATLVHEHVFVRDPALDIDLPHPEWDREAAVDAAVAAFTRLAALGVDTVVDLTVPGLGRDIELVAEVAARSPVRIIAATGWYSVDALPLALRLQGPGLLVDGPDPLEELFVRDLEVGIGGTGIRAGAIKVASGPAGMTPDVQRVFTAAARAHLRTGASITTHTDPATRSAHEHQELLAALDVPLDRVVLGHAGDGGDIDEMCALADRGSFIGFDRFGMEHVRPDEARVAALLEMLDRGYAERILLSQDAAVFSRVTPPRWRARHAPRWTLDHLCSTILPVLRGAGVADRTLTTLLVDNPRRLLAGA